MAEVALTKGKVAIVDDDMVEYLSQWTWRWVHGGSDTSPGYAVHGFRRNGKRVVVYMHRLIAEAPAGSEADHINRDSLDNRRANLRAATRKENMRNRGYRRSRPGYKGTSASGRYWRAQIMVDGKQILLGTYNRQIEAAMAYDAAAREYFGEFAALNFSADRDWLLPYKVEPTTRWHAHQRRLQKAA